MADEWKPMEHVCRPGACWSVCFDSYGLMTSAPCDTCKASPEYEEMRREVMGRTPLLRVMRRVRIDREEERRRASFVPSQTRRPRRRKARDA